MPWSRNGCPKCTHVCSLLGSEGAGVERPNSPAAECATSTSGREEHGGVYVVFADGSVALDSFYSNGRKGESIAGEGRVAAVSCHRGKLAVLTVGGGMTHAIAIYGFVVRLQFYSGAAWTSRGAWFLSRGKTEVDHALQSCSSCPF